jgi:microcystin-dependent protein
MPNYEATRYDWDGQYLTNVEGVNTGIIIPWTSTSVPSGFLECNGQSVSTTTYAALFAVVAYTYGGSGGSFTLPDLQDKTSLSRSNNKALASAGGANTVATTGNTCVSSVGSTTLTTAEMAAHTHNSTNPTGSIGVGVAGPAVYYNSNTNATGGCASHTHNISSANISGDATSVLQPYLTLMYIIKT